MQLNVSINVNNDCEIIASDNTQYNNNNIVLLEFLCYCAYDDDESTLLPIKDSKKISYVENNTVERIYKYHTHYDGYYLYAKYGIYKVESLLIEDTYQIKDKIFFYDNKVWLGHNNVANLTDIKTNSEQIVNWYKLHDYVGDKITYYSNIDLFTICKLEHCVFELQKKSLFDKISKCSKLNCEDNQEIKDIRDFLFVSMYVLNYLIDRFKYLEAQRILESLSACGTLCGSENFTSNKNCNC